jgi:hypothetical protein
LGSRGEIPPAKPRATCLVARSNGAVRRRGFGLAEETSVRNNGRGSARGSGLAASHFSGVPGWRVFSSQHLSPTRAVGTETASAAAHRAMARRDASPPAADGGCPAASGISHLIEGSGDQGIRTALEHACGPRTKGMRCALSKHSRRGARTEVAGRCIHDQLTEVEEPQGNATARARPDHLDRDLVNRSVRVRRAALRGGHGVPSCTPPLGASRGRAEWRSRYSVAPRLSTGCSLPPRSVRHALAPLAAISTQALRPSSARGCSARAAAAIDCAGAPLCKRPHRRLPYATGNDRRPPN